MYRQLFKRLLTLKRNSSKFHSGQIKFGQIEQFPGKLMTMKIDTPQFHSLFTAELKQLVGYFKKSNFELRIAGGAVRDLLMGKEPQDVDFATTATPDQMKEMFEKEKIRMINNKGEKHGTITARINDKENFEVTTLRIDVVTDGRHAEVQFTTNWQLDANRRDLTINAMFFGFDGLLYDYFNGKDDLDKRRVVFVGDAAERIQEDYLRILRYFRFYGRIAKGPECHVPQVLEAIKENAGGLAGISGERLWMEVKKILTGNYAGPIMLTMLDLNIGIYIGLPSSPDREEYLSVCKVSEELSPLAPTRLAALLRSEDEVYELQKRLKISNEELKTILFIVHHRGDEMGTDVFKYYRNLLIDTVGKEPRVKDRILELLKYKGQKDLLDRIMCWSPPKFPVTGHDLFTHKVPKGPVFAKTLNDLRQVWKKSDCLMTKEELMEKIDDIVKQHTS